MGQPDMRIAEPQPIHGKYALYNSETGLEYIAFDCKSVVYAKLRRPTSTFNSTINYKQISFPLQCKVLNKTTKLVTTDHLVMYLESKPC